MTYRPAPRIEHRSAGDIFEEIAARLETRVGWSRSDPPTEALIRVFARYWEIIASRLNQSLDKHFLAYLDLLGISPIPSMAATVPLTFTPVPNAPPALIVPARTQVAAAAGGEGEPVVFETLRALKVTSARLAHVFGLDPRTDTWTDLRVIADSAAPAAVPVFGDGTPAPHELLIGDAAILGLDHVSTLAVRFELEPGGPTGRDRSVLHWSAPGAKVALPLEPASDSTDGLSHSGEILFDGLAPIPPQAVRGKTSRWLSCRLTRRGGNWNSVVVRHLELIAQMRRAEVPIELAFADTAEIDLTKDFYPLGLRPVFGSTFYIASSEAFAHPGTEVSLDIRLTNPHDAAEEPPVRRVFVEGHPRVWWEYWNGTRWAPLAATDETKAFRIDGIVRFRVPEDFSPAIVRGVEQRWVRARLVSGHYGEDERWEVLVDPAHPSGMRPRPATLAPPSIQVLTASYVLTIVKAPECVLTSSQRVWEDVSARVKAGRSFPLLTWPCGRRPALYLAFSAPSADAFVNRPLELFVHAQPWGMPCSRSGADEQPALVRWEFWGDHGWQALDVRDGSASLTRKGEVTLLPPEAMRVRTDFVEEKDLYCFRLVSVDEGPEWSPAVRAILLNTVVAAHWITLENEVLGSSHALPDQRFQFLRPPILEGEIVEVREPVSTSELELLLREPSVNTIEVAPESGSSEVWIQWTPVIDFLDSGPGDRHYVLDRQTGEITFGNDRNGRIPPQGSNNIRVRRYRTGGGASGNQPAKALSQLRTAVPYIESVTNLVAASGGVDAEALDLVRDRGATMLRHRGRAVTPEDYEDLARLASPEVARAIAVPLRDLAADPPSLYLRSGLISVVVVPRHGGSKPLPDTALLQQVRTYLDQHRYTATDLVVVGPDYVTVTVSVEVIVIDVDATGNLTADLAAALDAFLHPLYGGPAGEGWRFGELPGRDDLYAVCASVPGVAIVHSLRVEHLEERVGVLLSRSFLICSGRHAIALRYSRDAYAAVLSGSPGETRA